MMINLMKYTMIKSSLKALLLCIITLFSTWTFAQNDHSESDEYSACVTDTINANKLSNINNAVVEVCSQQAKDIYEKQIVKLLDRIQKQDQAQSESQRYTDILKSQRLWKVYVDQECRNAGQYIGSPMYAFCPMQEYSKRVQQLQSYLE